MTVTKYSSERTHDRRQIIKHLDEMKLLLDERDARKNHYCILYMYSLYKNYCIQQR